MCGGAWKQRRGEAGAEQCSEVRVGVVKWPLSLASGVRWLWETLVGRMGRGGASKLRCGQGRWGGTYYLPWWLVTLTSEDQSFLVWRPWPEPRSAADEEQTNLACQSE